MPPPQHRIIEPCAIVVPVEGAAGKALGLEFFAVVTQLLSGGVEGEVGDLFAKGVWGSKLKINGAANYCFVVVLL
jgi:hypothetical protein